MNFETKKDQDLSATTTDHIFEKLLPKIIKENRENLNGLFNDINAGLSVRILGAKDMEWTILADEGVVKVMKGMRHGSIISIETDHASFSNLAQYFFSQKKWLEDFFINTDKSALNTNIQKNVEHISEIIGAAQLKISDNNFPVSLIIRFSGLPEMDPEIKIEIDQKTIFDLADEKLTYSGAFTTGKINITGNVNFLMQFSFLF